MRIGALDFAELHTRLRGPGLGLRLGPYSVALQSPFRLVAEGLHLLYADYPLVDANGFIELHVAICPPRGLRRWLRPQVLFHFDDFVPFKPLPVSHAFAFFEWGLNWCVARIANEYLLLHAAVLERGGRALLLPGAPGSGKSTLCAALTGRGWRLFSDEMALVSPQDGQVWPLPRPISLKNESIDVVRRDAPSAVIGPAAHDTAKGTVAHMKPPTDSVRRWQEPARPAWIVCPEFRGDSLRRLAPIGQGGMLMSLVRNAFNYGVLGVEGFHTAVRLVETCARYELLYGNTQDGVQAIESLVQASS